MTNSRKWLGLAAFACALASPALADGRDRAPIGGPVPLAPVECEHGYYADGTCYVPRQSTQVIHRPAVTRTVTHAPTTTVRRVVRTEAAAQSFDFSGFTGGVGSGVSGGYGGGGGGVIILRDGRRFSGVRSNAVGRVVLNRSFSGSSASFSGARHGGY
ncbi:MAG: hypothetical protein AAF216_02505 [Pseudomonadota bacterium]